MCFRRKKAPFSMPFACCPRAVKRSLLAETHTLLLYTAKIEPFKNVNAIHIICAYANDGCDISLCESMFWGVLVRKGKMLPKRLPRQY